MSKWKEVRLGEVIMLKRGYDLPLSKFELGKYPVIAASDLRGYHSDFKASPPVITLGRSGSIGDVQIVFTEAWPLNTTLYVKKFNGNNEIFIYYLLKTIDFKRFNSGAGVPTLNRNHLNKLKIKIPDLETQEKIAHVLSTYDELIENNNRRIELLENMAEEIYKEWFVRMRFPGHEKTKFVKGIPEGWEVNAIGDIAKFKRGKNLRIADSIEGSVPVIAGGIEPSCYHNEANTSAPVITVSASGANAGYTKLNYINVWASDCSYIDINDTNLIYYIYLLMKVSSNEILNLQTGSAQPHVYAKDINNFKFLKPNEWLIDKINNLSKEVFDEISLLNKQNQNLINQRDMLLPRLMNGTIEVN